MQCKRNFLQQDKFSKKILIWNFSNASIIFWFDKSNVFSINIVTSSEIIWSSYLICSSFLFSLTFFKFFLRSLRLEATNLFRDDILRIFSIEVLHLWWFHHRRHHLSLLGLDKGIIKAPKITNQIFVDIEGPCRRHLPVFFAFMNSTPNLQYAKDKLFHFEAPNKLLKVLRPSLSSAGRELSRSFRNLSTSIKYSETKLREAKIFILFNQKFESLVLSQKQIFLEPFYTLS